MPEQLLITSADCHAAAPWPDYEPYFEQAHRGAFREWYGADAAGHRSRPGEGRLFDSGFLDGLDESGRADGRAGTWDPDLRMRELDADGVAGEVIFPGAENDHVPFHGLRPVTERREPQPHELLAAGGRAYNRWLADLCAQNPERCAGVAFLDHQDIDAAVREIHWAHRAGLRGGIFLPAEWEDLPTYNHPRYEPIWTICEELGLPVNTHPVGSGPRPAFPADASPPDDPHTRTLARTLLF